MKSIAFFGHRTLDCDVEKLKEKMFILIENKILNGYDLFYFGGYGQFDKLAYDVVSMLKNKYLHIKRIYVRPYYEELPQSIENIYLQSYEKCEYFKSSLKGKYSIIGRNYCVVNHCDMCIFYVGKDG